MIYKVKNSVISLILCQYTKVERTIYLINRLFCYNDGLYYDLETAASNFPSLLAQYPGFCVRLGFINRTFSGMGNTVV